MTDLASLVLAVDSTSVKTGTAALDGLAASGARAEAATSGLAGGFKGAGAEAAAMAVAAQASARAAMDQAAGFTAATSAARVNTIAMRETLVVARELSRGNFTRIPGSLSLLATNLGSGGVGGLASGLAQMLGLIKTVQNAELAEAATAAATAAAGVRAAAERAGANVLAADTEIALAEAQARVAVGAEAEAAAQARLAVAHQAVAAAAGEAAIAENALGVAQGRAVETGAAAAAATRTTIGAVGIALVALVPIALLSWGAIKQFQDQVRDSGSLDQFAESLNLTDEQIKKVGGSVQYLGDRTREITGITVTYGDVIAGVWKAVADGASGSIGTKAWTWLTSTATSAFDGILKAWNVASAALSAGLFYVEDSIILAWQNFPATFSDIFVRAANLAITALNGLVKRGTDLLNGFIGFADKIPGVNVGHVGTPQIGLLNNPNAGAAAKGTAAVAAAPSLSELYAQELKRNDAFWAQTEKNAIQHKKDILQHLSDSDKPPKTAQPKKPKAPSDHGEQEAVDKLNAEIAGQWNLVAAYGAGDAAVIKATALQKAEEDAIKHKSSTGVFYELELQKAVATIAVQGAKTISNLNAEAGARGKVNALVAAGLIPASQANQAIQDELAKRELLAALTAEQEDLAAARHANDQKRIADDIAAIQRLLGLITGLPASQAADEAAKSVSAAQAQIAANDDEIAQIELKNSLLGHSNEEIAVALANLQTMQYLRDHPGIDDSTAAALAASDIKKAQLSNPSPIAQWAATVPQDAAAINNALQGIAVKGFDQLGSSIADVITGTKSLGAAFKDIANSIISDIIQMTVKMLLFRAISSIFGGGPSQALLTNNGSTAPITYAALGNAFSRGSIIPFADGGVIGNPTLFGMSGGRTGLMGEAGPEAVMPLSRDGSGRLGVRAANSNQAGPIEVHVIIDPSDKFDVSVAQQVVGGIAHAAPVIVKTAVQTTLRVASRPKITGGR